VRVGAPEPFLTHMGSPLNTQLFHSLAANHTRKGRAVTSVDPYASNYEISIFAMNPWWEFCRPHTLSRCLELEGADHFSLSATVTIITDRRPIRDTDWSHRR